MEDTLKIALGVFIGALAAAFTWEGIQTVRLELALKTASDQISIANKQAQKEATERQHAQTQEANRRRQEQADIQEKTAETSRLERLREADKAEAFKKFFQPSVACAADPNQMACANAFMKARTIFESQYQPSR